MVVELIIGGELVEEEAKCTAKENVDLKILIKLKLILNVKLKMQRKQKMYWP